MAGLFRWVINRPSYAMTKDRQAVKQLTLQFQRSKDPEQRKRLFEKILALIDFDLRSVLKRYNAVGMDDGDIYQEACLYLYRTVLDDCDPERGDAWSFLICCAKKRASRIQREQPKSRQMKMLCIDFEAPRGVVNEGLAAVESRDSVEQICRAVHAELTDHQRDFLKPMISSIYNNNGRTNPKDIQEAMRRAKKRRTLKQIDNAMTRIRDRFEKVIAEQGG